MISRIDTRRCQCFVTLIKRRERPGAQARGRATVAKLSDEKKRDRTILVIEGARERCRQERNFKLSKGVDPATTTGGGSLQKEVAKTLAQNEMKRRDVEEHNRVQQQRERDQAAEAEKKEADEKLFEKQWNR